MENQDLANGKNQELEASPMERNVKPADIIWVKNCGGLWWPAQAVDENLVSESNKPGKRSAGKVLVRLYGTYTYSYADPIKWRSEFDMVLEQNNGSYREIFMKSLEQDVARLRTGESKRQKSKGSKDEKSRQPKESAIQRNSKPNGKTSKKIDNGELKKKHKKNNEKRKSKHDHSTDEAGGNLTPKPSESHKKRKLNGSSPETMSCSHSQELSARRIRVMQSLGLAAPTGSPFGRNGQIYVSL